MFRLSIGLIGWAVLVSALPAQGVPSYARDVRPFFAKYCSECHNAKEMKAGLNLDSHKALMDGSDRGPVMQAGKPDMSLLLLLCEGKEKPVMPPVKARFRPKKEEIALVRAWIAAGAKDDSANVKVTLPAIKPAIVSRPPVTALLYVPERQELLVAQDQTLSWIDLRKKPFSSAVTMFPGPIAALARASKKDAYIAAIGRPGESGASVRFVSPEKTGAPTPLGHTDSILDLVYSPSAQAYATAGYDMQVRLVDDATGTTIHLLKEHSDGVYGLAFNPTGTLLASVSADRALKISDVAAGKLLYTLGEATDWLYAVAWSPDGRYLASGGVDKSIRIYEASATGAKLRQSVFAHEGPVVKLVFSSDSKTLYSVGQDRVVKAWDVERMVERKVYSQQSESVLCLALREDVGQIIVGRYDGVVQLIDISTGKLVHEFAANREIKTSARPIVDTGHTFLSAATIEDPKTVHPAKSPGVSPTTAPAVELPADFVGSLDRAGAVNFYRFDVKKNQQLGIQLITSEFKSKLEPFLTLTDRSGRILAESAEGHLGHQFKDAGTYAIELRDRDFRGGLDFKYRLRLGSIPIVATVFPLGLRQGTTSEVQVQGVFLDQNRVKVNIPADAKVGAFVPVPLTSKFGNPLGAVKLVVGEFPDVIESSSADLVRTLPVPGTANGRMDKENQKQMWSFAAKKGQRVVVEVQARRIGSRLDSVIEILDANFQPVPRALLRSQAKTYVTFRDHDSSVGGIRIEAWGELATNDYLYVGNELIKIQSLPTHPDADCIFFSAAGKRLAYFDTTPTHHANNTPMYKVTMHPPGTVFPSNGYPVFPLFYRNDDGGPGFGRDSRLIFDPPATGDYKIRIADARGMGGDNFGYRLTVRPPRPSFDIRFSPTMPAVSQGGAVPIAVSVDRLDGYDGPIDFHFEGLPPGFSAPASTIEAGTLSTAVALHAEVGTPSAWKTPMKVVGEAVIDGTKQSKETVGAIPKLIEPGDIRTWTEESEVTTKPGQQTKLKVHIERKAGFTGRVPIEVRGLPHGVRVLDIGLNGILITERETSRTIVLYAEPWVRPADHPFAVLARREGKNTEHAAKSVLLKIR